jgi:2-epi-5-epi-valiolone synthase
MPVTMTDDGLWLIESLRTSTFGVAMVDDFFENGPPELILGGTDSRRRTVVLDANVRTRYGEKILGYFRRHGIACDVIEVDITEETKGWPKLIELCDALGGLNVDRRQEPVIAIGGGVVTDVAGMAVSLLQRGVPWVRVVTTLQMIDAGTSAKTGINDGGKKSAFGTFHPPVQTIVDRRFLTTMDARYIVDVMAEAVKVGLVKDRSLFDQIEQHGRTLVDEKLQGRTEEGEAAALAFFRKSIDGSLTSNADNIDEEDLDRDMHAGHNIAHPIQMRSIADGEPALHGETVSADLAWSAALSFEQEMLSAADRQRVVTVLKRLGLPVWFPVMGDRQFMHKALAGVRKARAGAPRLPLFRGIGSCEFVSELRMGALERAAAWLEAAHSQPPA